MRFVSVGLLFCASFVSLASFAQSPDPCHRLHDVACAAADRNDGTGVTVNGAKIYDLIESRRAKVARDLKPKVAAQLSKDSAYKSLVYDAFGNELGLNCQIQSLSRTCLNTLASRTATWMASGKAEDTWKQGILGMYELVKSPITKSLKSSAGTRLLASIKYEKRNSEVEQMVKKLKTMMINRLERSIDDPAKLKLLSDQIQGIETHFSHAACGGEELSTLMVPNAFFQPPNSLIVCPGLSLYTTSAYTLSYTIAHEIAHSIGPAVYALIASEKGGVKRGTRKEFEDAHPFAKTMQCLRDVPNAGAKILKDSPLQYVDSNDKLEPVEYAVLATESDELNEAFSDWLGADLSSEYVEHAYPEATVRQRRIGYSNMARLQCLPVVKELPQYRSGYRRALTISTNPRVRKQMGCTDKPHPAASCGAGQIEASPSASDKVRAVK